MVQIICLELLAWVSIGGICAFLEISKGQHLFGLLFVACLAFLCRKHYTSYIGHERQYHILRKDCFYLLLFPILVIIIGGVVSITEFGVVGIVGRNIALAGSVLFYVLLAEAILFIPTLAYIRLKNKNRYA